MKPWETDGATYGYDGAGKRICTGSKMGRPTILPDDPKKTITLRMERLRFIDGCYDKGGAYWGAPANLYCAYAEEVQVFVRANSRFEAKKLVRDQIPGAHFYR